MRPPYIFLSGPRFPVDSKKVITYYRLVPPNNMKSVAIKAELHDRVRVAVAVSGDKIGPFVERAIESALPPANRKKTVKVAK